MKSAKQKAFEDWAHFEVTDEDEMDIQTSVAWENWQIAWNAAINSTRSSEMVDIKQGATKPTICHKHG